MARLDQELEALAKEFVCVRIIQMRGVDTEIFQFDYDLTWAAFFVNADLTVYGRYGSRNAGRDKSDQLYSVEALKTALRRALEIHKGYPANRDVLKEKRGKSYGWKTPEAMPALADRYGKPGELPKDCIHCHHVWKGVRRSMLAAKKTLPDNLLHLYPLPDTFGMQMDPATGISLRQVVAGSLADKAGLKAGDVVEAVNGAPIVSIADVQFILQNIGDTAPLKVEVTRGGKRLACTVNLCGDWRKAADFGWRDSTWEIRPGMKLAPLSADEAKAAGVKAGEGLKIEFMGPQSPARKAGFQDKDVLVSWGGQRVPGSEAEFLVLLRQKFLMGQKVKVGVMRGGKKAEVALEVP